MSFIGRLWLPPRRASRDTVGDNRQNVIQHFRTGTDNNPPPNNLLLDGELGIEQGTPMRVWVGVQPSLDPSGRKLLFDTSLIEGGLGEYLPLVGGTMLGPIALDTGASIISPSVTTGAAPPINILGGTTTELVSNTGGGVINITAGKGRNSADVRITAGEATAFDAGRVRITGGRSRAYAGGDIVLTGGQGVNRGGHITLTFGNSGLPTQGNLNIIYLRTTPDPIDPSVVWNNNGALNIGVGAPSVDLSTYLPLAGGTMLGAIYLPPAMPVADTEASHKAYVDLGDEALQAADDVLQAQIDVLAQDMFFAGGINVITDVGHYTIASGIIDGSPLPPPSEVYKGFYVIVTQPGQSNTTGNIPSDVYALADWIACDGMQWIKLPLGQANLIASEVAIVPAIGSLGANVQTGLTWLDANKLNLSGGTMTGGLIQSVGPGWGIDVLTTASIRAQGRMEIWSTLGIGTGNTTAAGLSFNSADGGYRRTTWQTTGKNRWTLDIVGFETGAEAGSNFQLFRFNDAGTGIGAALTINRASGLGTVAADPVSALGIATKQYVDTKVSTGVGAYLPLAGGVMSGGISFGTMIAANPGDLTKHLMLHSTGHGIGVTSNRLNYNVPTGVSAHWFRQGNIDRVSIGSTGITLSANVDVLLSRVPGGDLHAVPKQYVDAADLLLKQKDDDLQGQIDVLSENMFFIGGLNAVTDAGNYTVASGFTDGDPLPAPQDAYKGFYVIVTQGGSPPAGNIPAASYALGDWIACDGVQWIRLPLGQADIVASNVAVVPPIGALGPDVQTALMWLDEYKVNTAGDLLTGFLTLHSDPTAAMHAANKSYVDNALPLGGPFLPLAGGVMSGGIGFGTTMGSAASDTAKHITLHNGGYGFGVTAARLNYNAGLTGVHAFLIAGVEIARFDATGLVMWGAGHTVTLNIDPTAAMHAVPKRYVDNNFALTSYQSSGTVDYNTIPTTSALRQYGGTVVTTNGPTGGGTDKATVLTSYSANIGWAAQLFMGATGIPDTTPLYFRTTSTAPTGWSRWNKVITDNGGSFINGIAFTSAAVLNPVDLSKGIKLYSGTFGFSITANRLNIVSANSIFAVIGGADIASISFAGLTMLASKPLTLAIPPTATMHATTKQYVDAADALLQQEIDVLAEDLFFVGGIDAAADACNFTLAAVAAGAVDGDPLPPPQESYKGFFLIVTQGGQSPAGNIPPAVYSLADWIVCDGAQWVHLPIGQAKVIAQDVEIVPLIGALGPNVQTGLDWLDRNKFDKTGGVISGVTTFTASARALDVVDSARVQNMLTIGMPGATTTLLQINGAATSLRRIFWYTDGFARWSIGMSGLLEGGANAGASIQFVRFNDNGTSAGIALDFSRVTGLGTVAGNPTDPLGIATKSYVDSAVTGVTGSLANYLPLAGGTVFGLTIFSATGTGVQVDNNVRIKGGLWLGMPALTTAGISLDGTATAARRIGWYSGGAARWSFGANGVAESGSDAGTDLAFYRMNDAGTALGAAIVLSRRYGTLSAFGGIATTGGFAPTVTDLSKHINLYAGTYGINMTTAPARVNHVVPAGASHVMMIGAGDVLTVFGSGITVGNPTELNKQIYHIAAAGSVRRIYWQSGTLLRWGLGVNNGAESGADAGSDFQILRYADAGNVLLSVPFWISRKTGQSQIANGVSFGNQTATNQAASDMSKHIQLFGTTFGFSITSSRLNIVAPLANYTYIVGGNTDLAFFGQAGLTMKIGAVTLFANPTAAMHATPKQYVDAADAVLQGEIAVLAEDMFFCGGLNVVTDVGNYTIASGLTDGTALPAPGEAYKGFYVIVTQGGAAKAGNIPPATYALADWIACDGIQWIRLPLGQANVIASQVAITPAIGSLGANVQTGLDWLNRNKLNLTGGALTGQLIVNSPQGTGYGIDVYTPSGILARGNLACWGTTFFGQNDTNAGGIVQNSGPGFYRRHQWSTNGVARWTQDIFGTETGGDAGATWTLTRFSDTGVNLGMVVSFSRVDGRGTVAADPVLPLGIATKQYVDARELGGGGAYLPLAGGSLTGFLFLHADPTIELHAATKRYVDEVAAGGTDAFLPLTGGALSGFLTLHANPTANLHAAPKQYIDVADQVLQSQIDVLASDMHFIGGLNVVSDIGNYTIASGFTDGDPLPAPQDAYKGFYVIVTQGGTSSTGGVIPPATYALGDWIACDGLQWIRLPLGQASVIASEVAIMPAIGSLGANVQTGLGWLNTNKFNITGGTVSGATTFQSTLNVNSTLTVGISTGAANANLFVIAPAGKTRYISFKTANVTRWIIGANGNTESTGNLGSDFGLYRYADDGTYLNAPLMFYRSTGLGTVAGDPTAALGIATKQYVDTKVAGATAGVSSFNTRTGAVTLALSDVTGAGGAPLASPAFTGDPRAPTPATADNDTSIATTAFVKAQGYATTGYVDSADDTLQMQIDVLADDMFFIGGLDPVLDVGNYTVVSGFTDGDPLPAASEPNKGFYVICSQAGTAKAGNIPPGVYAAGDWIACNGEEWIHLPLGTARTIASQVYIEPPIGSLGATVQTGLSWLNTNKTDLTTTDARYLKLTGGTVTGPTTFQSYLYGYIGAIFGTNTATSVNVQLNSATGVTRYIIFKTANTNRWIIGTNSTAEAAPQSGSDFGIFRYANDGSYLGAPMMISRGTGLATVSGDPTAPMGIATKQYADTKLTQATADGRYINTAGDTMTGTLNAKALNVAGLFYAYTNSGNVIPAPGAGLYVTWNYSGGQRELNLWAGDSLATGVAFRFHQITGAATQKFLADINVSGAMKLYGNGLAYGGLAGGGAYIGFTWASPYLSVWVDGVTLGPIATTAYVDAADALLQQEIDILAQDLFFVGAIQVPTDACIFTVASALPAGPLPAPGPANKGFYVIVTQGGAPPAGNIPAGDYVQHDWIVSDGTQWFHLKMGLASVIASDVAILPAIGALGANVQTGLQYLETNKLTQAQADTRYVNATGDAMTGGLSFGNALAPGGVGDVTRHIALYGTGDGIGITTGRMNIVTGSSVYVRAVAVDKLKIDANGLTMLSGMLTLTGPPTADLHAATKAYVDTKTVAGTYVAKAGDTMTGALNITMATTATTAQMFLRPNNALAQQSKLRFGGTFASGGDLGARLVSSIRSGMVTTWTDGYLDVWVNTGQNDAATDASQARIMRFQNALITADKPLRAGLGIEFNNAIVTVPTDLSRHVKLFNGYGFSITSSTVNYITGGRHDFYAGATNVAKIDGAGLTIIGATRHVLLATDPTAALHATPKQYVDAADNFLQMEIDVLSEDLFFVGGVDVVADACHFTQVAIASGAVEGGPLPLPQESYKGFYVIVTQGGAAKAGNIPAGVYSLADWIVCNGAEWVWLPLGQAKVIAQDVEIIPLIGSLGANVQSGLTWLNTNKTDLTTTDARYLKLTGGVLSGGLGFGARVGANNWDITKHISLHTAGYGFGVTTGRLNYNVPTANSHVFLSSNIDYVTISNLGIVVNRGGAGWSGHNWGRSLVVYGPNSNPAIAIADSASTNFVGICNSGGKIVFAKMPALDAATIPTLIMTLDPVAGSMMNAGGLGFGSQTGATPQDLSKHLRLYASSYGFSITGGTMNIVSGGTIALYPAGATRVMRVTNTGITIDAGAITLLADPTAPLHAATKQYVDAKVAEGGGSGGDFLPLSGGTLTGPLAMSPHALTAGTITSTTDIVATGAIYAGYGLNSQVGIYGTADYGYLFFERTNQWCLVWSYASGALSFSNSITSLFTCDGSGAFQTAGGIYPSASATGWGMVLWGDALYRFVRFTTDNWMLRFDAATGLLTYFNPSGSSLFNCDGSGNFYALASVTSGYIRSSGAFMCDSGVFYVANNINYYLARNSVDGAWRFVEGGVPKFTVMADGNCFSAGTLTAQGSRIITYGTNNNPSVTVWNQGAGYAAGIFCGEANRLCFGSMTGAGDVNVYHGFLTASSLVFMGGNVEIQVWGSAYHFCWGDNGSFNAPSMAYKPGGGSWSVVSDIRTKTVLGDYDRGLAAILALRPVRFKHRDNWRRPSDPEMTTPHRMAVESDTTYVGLVAQEAEIGMPEMVSRIGGDIDGTVVDDLRVLDTTALPFAIVNAIKELVAMNEALTARVAALETRTLH
jgi:hypothetical protein